jgi:hypothetical protein
VLLISSADVTAQEPGAPELRPLERYRGSWTYEGEDQLLGGKVTCKVLRRWISGGYFMESQRTCETPRGTRDEVEIYGFDFKAREYTYYGFTGRIVHTYRSASLDGASVQWVGIDTSRGIRCTDVFETDQRSFTEKCEAAAAAGTFELRSDGRFKRVQ